MLLHFRIAKISFDWNWIDFCSKLIPRVWNLNFFLNFAKDYYYLIFNVTKPPDCGP